MKRKEKERLIKSDIQSIKSNIRHAFNQGYDLGYKEGLQKHIKRLSSVNPQSETDVLDKIRTEIEIWHKEGTNWSDTRLINIEDILAKYYSC